MIVERREEEREGRNYERKKKKKDKKRRETKLLVVPNRGNRLSSSPSLHLHHMADRVTGGSQYSDHHGT